MVHTVQWTNRERIGISGVQAVDAFDEHAVCLQTTCGSMRIEGASLRIEQWAMEQGQLAVVGTLGAVVYADAQKKKERRHTMWKKWFS
ncbi:MAG: sporulation protein YabP [Paenibacillaceae bacterium]|nr:sporulation protein YabP [Paenibacillaceae bacterium]